MLYRWAKVMQGRVVIYDYDQGMLVWRDIPNPSIQSIRQDIKHYRKAGILGVSTESRGAMATVFLNLYVRGQLYWNPDADVDALLAEFYEKFYGPAAKPMAAYWNAIINAWDDTHRHRARVLRRPGDLHAGADGEAPQAPGRGGEAGRAAGGQAGRGNEKLYLERMKFTRLGFDVLDAYMAMVEGRGDRGGLQGRRRRRRARPGGPPGAGGDEPDVHHAGDRRGGGDGEERPRLVARRGASSTASCCRSPTAPRERCWSRAAAGVGLPPRPARHGLVERLGVQAGRPDLVERATESEPKLARARRTDRHRTEPRPLGDAAAPTCTCRRRASSRRTTTATPATPGIAPTSTSTADAAKRQGAPTLPRPVQRVLAVRQRLAGRAPRSTRNCGGCNDYKFEWDVDLSGQVKAGANTIAVRMHNPHHFGGMFRRPFLYKPAGK